MSEAQRDRDERAPHTFTPALRLHPLSWLFVLLASIRQFIVPLIAVLLFGARDDGSMWGVVFVVPLVAAAIWRQRVFRYGFGPRGLVIREGLLFRSIRQIEYERIENIDTQRGPLHRLLGVAEVRLESSVGGKPEAMIRVLGLDAVQALREQVFGEARAQAAAPARAAERMPEEVLLRLPPGELMRYGFVDNRGMLVVAAVLGLLSQSGFVRMAGEYLQANVSAQLGGATRLVLLAITLGAVITIVLLVRLLSLAWALVALHDFTLSRHGDDLRIRHGLLTRVALTLRLPRIQAAHLIESWLHRFFGRVSLAVDLAGGRQVDERGAAQSRIRWLAPICTPEHANKLMRIVLPMLGEDTEPRWQPLACGARLRIFRKATLVATLLLAPPAIWWMGVRAPILWLAIVPLAWLHAARYVRHARWALTREALLFERGWLTRRLTLVPRSRVQVVRRIASPFDRRRRMATLIVDTAGAGAVAGKLRIAYLPQETAAMLAEALYASAASGSASAELGVAPAV